MVRRMIVWSAPLAVVLSFGACGGGKYSAPTTPSAPAPTPPAAFAIDIRANNASQSFAPNPAAISQGRMVVWRNADTTVHRIVANDGTFDTGNIAPGSSSSALSMPRGTNYHCSLHTTMVGAIGIEAEAPPPCTGPYC
jgi:plastocyanin